jgi:hypothetical protein
MRQLVVSGASLVVGRWSSALFCACNFVPKHLLFQSFSPAGLISVQECGEFEAISSGLECSEILTPIHAMPSPALISRQKGFNREVR